jgi:hypothetical protein
MAGGEIKIKLRSQKSLAIAKHAMHLRGEWFVQN